MTFPLPCHAPIAFARVPLGIPSQSTSPNTAATSALITPAKIIQYATRASSPRFVIRYAMSKNSDVARRPSGKTMSI